MDWNAQNQFANCHIDEKKILSLAFSSNCSIIVTQSQDVIFTLGFGKVKFYWTDHVSRDKKATAELLHHKLVIFLVVQSQFYGLIYCANSENWTE